MASAAGNLCSTSAVLRFGVSPASAMRVATSSSSPCRPRFASHCNATSKA
eukprot:CAMPEP_0118861102 /NCGR_PEP_ID=MMETSP1163-20130328/6746_1 /TAXON_ID=124430 /ORGANISM="Phaeomonas parva, Strain CCMP2877" /LENGTH=49 /DNA_ID=CAMNT_0006794887 /DNA_START=53 /DNA_END=202 /DNA_ORIENTATION=-